MALSSTLTKPRLLLTDEQFRIECANLGIVKRGLVYVQLDDQSDLLGSEDTSFEIGDRAETERYLVGDIVLAKRETCICIDGEGYVLEYDLHKGDETAYLRSDQDVRLELPACFLRSLQAFQHLADLAFASGIGDVSFRAELAELKKANAVYLGVGR